MSAASTAGDPNVANADAAQQTPLHVARARCVELCSIEAASSEPGIRERAAMASRICELLEANGAVSWILTMLRPHSSWLGQSG